MVEVVERSIRCPHCDGTKFRRGPSGGLSTNVLCANEQCRRWFNHCDVTGELTDLDRAEPTAAERAAEQERHVAEAQERERRWHDEGARAYVLGQSALDLLRQPSEAGEGWYGDYALGRPGAFRLAGWMDAATGRLRP